MVIDLTKNSITGLSKINKPSKSGKTKLIFSEQGRQSLDGKPIGFTIQVYEIL